MKENSENCKHEKMYFDFGSNNLMEFPSCEAIIKIVDLRTFCAKQKDEDLL